MSPLTKTSTLAEDADFVISLSADPAGAEAALRGLGYQQLGGTYRHDSNAFTVEFPPGPLGIGDDLDLSYDTVGRGDELLYIISRTDCVRDRLAAFYFFNDRSALKAAVGVAASGTIDLPKIERWSTAEDQASRFGEFRRSLEVPRHD